ncbi:MAG: ComEC/Rec2 family competence protein, partial [Chlamydiota bacterium]
LVVLMLLLLLYMLYVGTAPSLIRALISIEIIFLGQFLSRTSNSINRLGLALIIILLMDPQNALRLSFQLSFLATLGILLFYKPFEALISYTLVRSYPLKEALGLKYSHQVLYIIANFLKKSLALGLSVNIFLYPVLIAYFNQFPLLCLIYNLFFPFLVTFSMALLLLALLLDPLYMGVFLHKLNLLYTDIILKTVTGLPAGVKLNIYGHISTSTCILIICATFLMGISLQKRPSQFNL